MDPDTIQSALEDSCLLDFIASQFVGMKWADCGPLAEFRPEDAKYINSEGEFRDALTAAMKGRLSK